MYSETLGPKDPEEIKVLKFPFLDELGGATIASVAYATPTTYRGIDASPGLTALGVPVISGTDVLQRMQGGVSGVDYKWRVKVVDSSGNTHVSVDVVRVQEL